MANHFSHAALPYPVKGARFTIQIPYLDADGDPTDPTTPDSEVSKDGGAFADCTEESTTITGGNGFGFLTLSSTEMDASMIALALKAASGPKTPLMMIYPRVLPVLYSGTASAGAAGTITFPIAAVPRIASHIVGCIVKTTGGTGGGSGGNQARVITAFSAAGVASVSPNWETNPDATTTFEVLLTPECKLALAMTPDLLQTISQMIYPYANNIFVREATATSNPGDNSADGKCPATAKATITGAQAVDAADDAIIMAAGDYTENSGVVQTPGTALLGPQGASNMVRINSTLALGSGAIFNPGTNCYFANFEVVGTAAAGVYQIPIGNYVSGGDQAATNFLGRSVRSRADSDGILIDHTSACDGVIHDYEGFANYDVVAQFQNPSAKGLTLVNPLMHVVGPSLVTSWNGDSRGCTCTSGVVRLITPNIHVRGGAGQSRAIGIHMTDNTGLNGRVICSGGMIDIHRNNLETQQTVLIDATDGGVHTFVDGGIVYSQSNISIASPGSIVNYQVSAHARAIQASAIGATQIQANAFTAAKFAADYFTAVDTAVGTHILATGWTRVELERAQLAWLVGQNTRVEGVPGEFTITHHEPGAGVCYSVIADEDGVRAADGTKLMA